LFEPGDPNANSGAGAENWGLWRKDPGPRGVRLYNYDKCLRSGHQKNWDVMGFEPTEMVISWDLTNKNGISLDLTSKFHGIFGPPKGISRDFKQIKPGKNVF